ncbi:hypothetical protein GJ496_006513 [Pomphorhynchus laevis]|nr:hypothetical protein GJ496_006513 [Pomphorhynchus laevis]
MKAGMLSSQSCSRAAKYILAELKRVFPDLDVGDKAFSECNYVLFRKILCMFVNELFGVDKSKFTESIVLNIEENIDTEQEAYQSGLYELILIKLFCIVLDCCDDEFDITTLLDLSPDESLDILKKLLSLYKIHVEFQAKKDELEVKYNKQIEESDKMKSDIQKINKILNTYDYASELSPNLSAFIKSCMFDELTKKQDYEATKCNKKLSENNLKCHNHEEQVNLLQKEVDDKQSRYNRLCESITWTTKEELQTQVDFYEREKEELEQQYNAEVYSNERNLFDIDRLECDIDFYEKIHEQFKQFADDLTIYKETKQQIEDTTNEIHQINLRIENIETEERIARMEGKLIERQLASYNDNKQSTKLNDLKLQMKSLEQQLSEIEINESEMQSQADTINSKRTNESGQLRILYDDYTHKVNLLNSLASFINGNMLKEGS